MPDSPLPVTVRYFAMLREERGQAEEVVRTTAESADALYAELKERHGFSLSIEAVRLAVNDEFASWDTTLEEGDDVGLLPPVSGG